MGYFQHFWGYSEICQWDICNIFEDFIKLCIRTLNTSCVSNYTSVIICDFQASNKKLERNGRVFFFVTPVVLLEYGKMNFKTKTKFYQIKYCVY